MNLQYYFIAYTPTGYILPGNYLQIWAQVKTIAEPLYANQTIIGFFLGDELVWNGLNMTAYYSYANLVRADFPDAIIWSNEATPPMESGVDFYGHHLNYSVPPVLSWISVDLYHICKT